MKDIVGHPHFIFSVENPIYPPTITPPSHEQAMQWLKAQGEDATEALGHYGAPERSIIVKNPKNVVGLQQLAQDTGQESVIHSKDGKHEMRYLNGPHRGKTVHGQGTEVFGEAPPDMFTTVKDAQGDPVHFRHNFDFGTLTKSEGDEERGFCTMFLFDGVDKPDILHVTHKYFDKSYKDEDAILEVLKKWFKEKPFKEFTEKFDKEEWFGKDNDVRVLCPESNKKFLPDLKDKLDQLIPDKWPEYKPHTAVSSNVECIDFPVTDYVLVKNGKVIWSTNSKLYKSEILLKAPIPHSNYDIEDAKSEGLPDLMNNDELRHTKTVKLPNGLEYRKFKNKNALTHQDRTVHALYHPQDNSEPVAYMETAHEQTEENPKGYHPHAVTWSEVQPMHRGKGLGRQLYLATLLHGTGQLTSDAMVSPEAHKMWQSFKSYPGLGGKISYYPQKNELQAPTANLKLANKALERHHVFIRDKSKLNLDQMFPFVNYGSLAASDHTEDWLIKAVDDKAWNRIIKAHNKGVREDVVDSSGHIGYFNTTHPEYQSHVLDSDKKRKTLPSRGMGVVPKMIHEVPGVGGDTNQKFMAKPYHAPLERWAKSWTKHPIKGWATLTTKKLFDAAKVPELAEDISAHVHKGVPIIVSKFHPNATESYGSDEPFAPKDTAKILLMDFLTNNQDRHAGNIMRLDHQPLAIDHERNFQYFDKAPGSDPNVSPWNALRNSGFAYKNSKLPDQIPTFGDDLVDWWGNSRHNIKKELQRNLKFIKDPAIKRHIEDNFNARWDWVNDKMGSDPSLLFDKSTMPVERIPYAKGKKQ